MNVKILKSKINNKDENAIGVPYVSIIGMSAFRGLSLYTAIFKQNRDSSKNKIFYRPHRKGYRLQCHNSNQI
jgi:hypothetical protein